MLRTFNCGVGGILVVKKEAESSILKMLASDGATLIGRIQPIKQGKIFFHNFS